VNRESSIVNRKKLSLTIDDSRFTIDGF